MQSPENMKKLFLSAVSFAALVLLAGCGSSSNMSSSSGTGSGSGSTAPALITVSDAPLGSILSAKVTLSAVSLGASGGTSVSVLSQPETIELSGLGAVQEPIELTNVAFGTYSSVSVTVSSATVTYVNSTGQVVTASATLNSPSVTVSLNPALTISTNGEVQLQIAFNLSQSFSISGSTVTFTPAISTTGAQVENESDNERQIEVAGQVTAVSSTSITVQCGDSGKQFTFTINGSTQFPSGVTASSIGVGSFVQINGQAQTDGSMLALSITPIAGGSQSGQEGDGGKGIVVAVTHDGSGNLTGFSMVPQMDFGSMMSGGGSNGTINVVVSSSTTYGINENATNQGLTSASFSAAEIFAGQAVMVAGSTDNGGNLDAARIVLGAENVPGTLAATPQASGSNLDFGITVQVPSFLNTYQKLVTLNAVAGPNTEYDNGMTSSSFASAAAGTAIQTRGFLLVDQNNNFVLYASKVSQPDIPEKPEGN
ncbi:MAG: DUF5666 domain-containing protein [Acidobacteriota bacterium]